jgi:hypothetical protein
LATRTAKISFIAGEVSPVVNPAIETEKYTQGMAKLENYMVDYLSGIKTSPATKFITECYNTAQLSRFIEFQFNEEQAYMLEFAHNIMRIFRNKALVHRDIVDSAVYKWTLSGSGTNEYYLELLAGGDPSLLETAFVLENGTKMTNGTVGSLSAGEYDHGDNDALGFSTFYVRLTDNVDPDTKTDGYVQIPVEVVTPYPIADVDAYRDIVDSTKYRWDLSGLPGPSKYYLVKSNGGDPELRKTDFVLENGTAMTETATGILGVGEWAYGDGDSLGFNTFYVRLTDGTDPDTKSTGYVQIPFNPEIVNELDGEAKLADTIYIHHPHHRIHKVTRTSHTDWTITELTQMDGPYKAIEDGDRLITINAIEGTPWTLTSNSPIFANTKFGDPVRLGFPVPGVSGARHWTTFYIDELNFNSDYTRYATPVEDEQNGIVYEEIADWDFLRGIHFWEDHTDGVILKDIVDSINYQWTASGGGTNEYYLEVKGGGDPGVSEPDRVVENGIRMDKGTLGSLPAGDWGYGDNDVLGYDTVYVRLTDEVDPDTKANGYIKTANGSVITYDDTNKRAVLEQGSDDTATIQQNILTFNQIKHRLTIEVDASSGTLPLLTVNIGTTSLAVDILSESYSDFTNPINIDFIPTADNIFLSLITKGIIDIRNPSYKWTVSGAGVGEYYLELAAGGDPGLPEPDDVYENGVALTLGVLGGMAVGQWAYGNNDALGYDTIYVKLNPAVDPDTKALEWVEAGYDSLPIGDIIEVGSVSLQKRDNLPGATQEQNTNDWRLAAWNSVHGYPRYGLIDNQRLISANNEAQPQTLWPSKLGDFEKHEFNTPANSTDAFSFNPSTSKLNGIRWILEKDGLKVGTAGAIWRVFPPAGGALSETNLQIEIDTSYGSLDLRPIVAYNAILITPLGKEPVLELLSSLESKGFATKDIGSIANHLHKNRRIIRWAFAKDPDSVVWCILDNGQMIGMTYHRERNVWAWHRRTNPLGAGYNDIAIIPNSSDDNIDDVYLIVNRAEQGETPNYYIETFEPRIVPQEAAFGLTASGSEDDYRLLDSSIRLDIPLTITNISQADPGVVDITGHGLSDGDFIKIANVEGMTEINNVRFADYIEYKVANKTANDFELNDADDNNVDTTGFSAYISGGEARKMETSISGFDHLEGETITALADGVARENLTVSSGLITIPRAAFVLGGIPVIAEAEMLDIETIFDTGGTQGRIKGIKSADIYFIESRNGKIYAKNKADVIRTIEFENESFGEWPAPLFDGIKNVDIHSDHGKDIRLVFKQDKPYPQHIARAIIEVDYAG